MKLKKLSKTQYLIKGRGFGHGVGLSQWGARGMALQGFNYQEIIQYYYPGTLVKTTAPINTTVRVGLYLGKNSASISTTGPYQLIDQSTLKVLYNGLKAETWQAIVNNNQLTLTSASDSSLSFSGINLSFLPLNGTKLGIEEKKNSYRGSLKISLNQEHKLNIINLVNLEDYLLGVVTKESFASWPLEALKVQSVVSRSYVLQRIQNNQQQTFDIYDSTLSQVYGGIGGESKTGTQAVSATTGQIATYEDKVIEALFHANSGGHTESNNHIWSGYPIPYLQAVPDEYSGYETNDLESRYGFWWQKTYHPQEIEKAFNAQEANSIGKLIALAITDHYPSGRPSLVKLVGTKRVKEFTNSQFRSVLDPSGKELPSNWFEIHLLSLS